MRMGTTPTKTVEGRPQATSPRAHFRGARRAPARTLPAPGWGTTSIGESRNQVRRDYSGGVRGARHDGRQANGQHGREADDRRAAYDGCDDAAKEARSGEEESGEGVHANGSRALAVSLLSRSGPRPPPSPDRHSSGNSPSAHPPHRRARRTENLTKFTVSGGDRWPEHVSGNRELPRAPTHQSQWSWQPPRMRRPSRSPSGCFPRACRAREQCS